MNELENEISVPSWGRWKSGRRIRWRNFCTWVPRIDGTFLACSPSRFGRSFDSLCGVGKGSDMERKGFGGLRFRRNRRGCGRCCSARPMDQSNPMSVVPLTTWIRGYVWVSGIGPPHRRLARHQLPKALRPDGLGCRPTANLSDGGNRGWRDCSWPVR